MKRARHGPSVVRLNFPRHVSERRQNRLPGEQRP